MVETFARNAKHLHSYIDLEHGVSDKSTSKEGLAYISIHDMFLPKPGRHKLACGT